MGREEFLTCDSCGKRFPSGEVELTCPACGPWLGTLTVHFDCARVGRELSPATLAGRSEPSHWRYLEILPVAERPACLHPRVGMTPLYELPALARALGLGRLWVKDDGLNPSASFKDRASSVGVARALLGGREVITAASTGNAASSLSLFAACAGLRAVIFVPETAPQAKVAQLLMFGAEVLMVRGSYDQAFDLCLETAVAQGWYCRNTAVNPYLGEGKKTAALEIVEQLGFEPPDAVVVSVGDGCILSGTWKGFSDAQAMGWCGRRPRLLGVQARGASPLVAAFERGERAATPGPAQTLADSICVGAPRDHLKALRAVRDSGGAMLAVEDEEILGAMRRLAREAGVFAEPAGATAFAGLLRLRAEGRLGRGERVVVLVTGNGLKDVASAIRAVERKPTRIEPTSAAVAAWLAGGQGR
ncbi:MAG TPA: threonine synthase [Myxococcota bacterium]|nr:threonine synthase [Myxococcota bacterium]HRY92123.1 threonine synthase [Myxococcota bacterium]HSA22604.1 threonine synthase [Myxococcota bacterium]